MKALSIRIAAGIIVLVGLIYFLACSPSPPQNGSMNQNVTGNQNQAIGNSVAKEALGACENAPDPGSHAQHIKDDIKDKMRPSLKKLLKDASNPDGTFTVEVTKAQNASYFIARIRGKISGDDNLKELSTILNDFQKKQECLRVVYFLPDATGPSITGDPGFEWSSCEYPMRVCPNGECCMTVEPNENTNANTPRTNTNSNGNRSTNTSY